MNWHITETGMIGLTILRPQQPSDITNYLHQATEKARELANDAQNKTSTVTIMMTYRVTRAITITVKNEELAYSVGIPIGKAGVVERFETLDKTAEFLSNNL